MKKLYPYILMALIFGFVMFLTMLIVSPPFGLKTIAIVALLAGIAFSVLMYMFASSKQIKNQAALTLKNKARKSYSPKEPTTPAIPKQ